ncbi:hypothetical protein CCO02nite_00710 [Cellulomonas composti]|uniref:HTH luxR-type domain-containing protein n=2 Tax=Cellulomonas composti TaxID=266130 RepID=A0A511J6T4_9CELL|nr:hypothetical protein CCO02nite_00710 [Cellulomonas composti]
MLRARCTVPTPARVVRRAALDELLENAVDRRLTVVSAGPGWGKTVAVAQWAATTDRAVAWLTLEASNDSSVPFWSEVLAALRASEVVPADHPLAALRVPAVETSEFHAQLFHALEALPERVVLVLDDFHHVTRREILDVIDELLRYDLPLRLVVVTRIDPLLRQHRLRVEGELSEVFAADLAFDGTAVAELARSRGRELTGDDVARVLEQTDGWAVGVRLVMPAPGHPGATVVPQQHASEYLVAEVLDRLEPDMRHVLLMTSVTTAVCEDLVEAVLPGGEARRRWRAFVTRNAFVTPIGADGTWYRYHPLLRDMLLGRLRADAPQDALRAHRRAARWLASHGEPVLALVQARHAGDWALFGRLFVEVGSVPLVSAARGQMIDLLGSIPYAELEPDVGIELCVASLAVATGRFAAATTHVMRARALLDDDADAADTALLEIVAATASRGAGDPEAARRAAAAALVALDGAIRPSAAWPGYHVLAVNSHAVGLLWRGDVEEARRQLDALVATTRTMAPLLPVLNARSYHAFAEALLGRLDLAREHGLQVIDDARDLGWASHLQCRPAYAAVAWAALLRGVEDEADRMLALGLASDLNGQEPQTTLAVRLMQAMVAVQRGRLRAAEAALRSAGPLDDTIPPALADLAARVVREVAQRAGRAELTDGTTIDPTTALGHVHDAQAHLDRGDTGDAITSAIEASVLADREQDPLVQVEALLMLARAYERTGTTASCDEALERALRVAAEPVLVRPFLLLPTASLVARTRTLLDTHPGELANRLRTRLLVDQRHHEHEPEPLVEALTSRELAILGALPTMGTNSEIASDFFVSVNTVKAHLKSLYRKLGVDSRREAVRRGRELGLL